MVSVSVGNSEEIALGREQVAICDLDYRHLLLQSEVDILEAHLIIGYALALYARISPHSPSQYGTELLVTELRIHPQAIACFLMHIHQYVVEQQKDLPLITQQTLAVLLHQICFNHVGTSQPNDVISRETLPALLELLVGCFHLLLA